MLNRDMSTSLRSEKKYRQDCLSNYKIPDSYQMDGYDMTTPDMFTTNNNNVGYYQQDKSKRHQTRSCDMIKSSRHDAVYDLDRCKSIKFNPIDDWKVSMVSGKGRCDLIKKTSRPLILVPGNMEILGDINNSSNDRKDCHQLEDVSSTTGSDQNDPFLQEISQFSASTQSTVSSHLMKKYQLQVPGTDGIYSDILKRIIKYLHKSWLNQSMCDVIIATDSGDILTHQVILAAYSPTLDSLFEQNRRPLPQFVQINMNDYPRETVMEVVNFLYTTNLQIDCKDINNFVAVARQLDLPEIINICGLHLTKNYDHDNIFLHYSVAANNNLKNSKNYLLKVIAMNYSLLVHHNHFLFIPIDRLNEILSHEALSGEELDILLSIIKWIDFNRPERITYSKQLFSHIRFELVDPEAIANQVEIHEWLFSDKVNKDLISEAYKYHALMGPADNSKNPKRSSKQFLSTDNEVHMSSSNIEESTNRSVHPRHVVSTNGSNNIKFQPHHHSTPLYIEKHLITEDFPDEINLSVDGDGINQCLDRYGDQCQQQRQISSIQFQLEKNQRRTYEQTLQTGSVVSVPEQSIGPANDEDTH